VENGGAVKIAASGVVREGILAFYISIEVQLVITVQKKKIHPVLR